jgi:hypothetical protein
MSPVTTQNIYCSLRRAEISPHENLRRDKNDSKTMVTGSCKVTWAMS